MKKNVNLAELILKIAQNPMSLKGVNNSKFFLDEEANLSKDEVLFLKERYGKSTNEYVSEQIGKDTSASIAQGGGGGGCVIT